MTISLKNMMGAITTGEMQRFHRESLSQCIADLNSIIKPDLSIVDATSVMTRRGPTGGDMVEMDTIMASRDPVAADSIAAHELQGLEEHLDVPSFEATEVRHINYAAELGVGTSNLYDIEIIEEVLS